MGGEDRSRSSEGVAHLQCSGCDSNPSVALIDGNEVLVCHCTHVDSQIDPVQIHGFDSLPEPWEFVESGGVPCPEPDCGIKMQSADEVEAHLQWDHNRSESEAEAMVHAE